MSIFVDASIVSPDTNYKSLVIKNEKLKKALEIAREKLGFYAGEEGLNDMAYDGDGEPIGYIDKTDIELIPTSYETVDIVSGKRARQALKEIEEVLK